MIKSQTMEQTRAEGRNERAVLGRQEMLLDVLRLRSGEDVPTDLADLIHARSDEAQLRTWLAVAVEIDTLDSFRQQTGL